MELKIAVLIIVATISNVLATTTYSQVARVSLEMDNAKLETVMDEIERQSEFYFIFNQKQIDVNRIVNVQIDNKLIAEILPDLFTGTDVNYVILDRKILLTTDPVEDNLQTIAAEAILHQRQVSGRIVDETGAPIPGVNIQIEGTTQGTVSDVNGNYSLSVPNDNAVLLFSFVGYNTQRVVVGSQTSIDINLVPGLVSLDEVVVVGYGTQRKVDLTGSIVSVGSKDITTVPVTRLDQALQGRAAGVMMRQNTFNPGPGSISLVIRGLNSINGDNTPLFVIDGVIGGNINAIDPNDIQSIDVLKDAAAASIYGSRGANGVVLVTTKKGVAGKPKVSFDGYYGIAQPIRTYDVMNAQEYMEYVNDVRAQGGNDPAYPNIQSVLSQVGEGTDWQKELFGTGTNQKYYLSISGGTENVVYNASGGYLKTTGMMMNVDYSKFTSRFGLDVKASDRLSLSGSVSYAADVNNSMNETFDGRMGTISIITTPPMLSPKNELGEYPPILYNTYEVGSAKQYHNSFAALDKEVRESLGTYFQFNLGAQYRLTDWLKYDFTFGSQPTISESRYFRPHDIPDVQSFEQATYATKNSSRSKNWIIENLLTLDKSLFNDHRLTFIVGTSTQKINFESTGAGSKNFPFDQYQFHNLGAGVQANYTVSSSQSDQQLQSFLSRINYSIKDKYLIQLNGRYDGSSKFAPGNKWAFFPAASVGWRLSEEDFISNMDIFNNLKLRASYGSIGSHGINPYSTMSLVGGTFAYGFNNTRVGTYGPSGIANKDLKWETTTQFDIGLDIGIMDNRLNVTLDYYHKKTTDLLLNQLVSIVNNPTTNHNPSITKNIGSLQNTGFEFSVNYRTTSSAPLQWSVDFNGTFQSNKLLDLALAEGTEFLLLGDNLRRNYHKLEEGEAFGNYAGYITDGLYQTQAEIDGSAQPTARPGDMKYVDQNNDGTISSADFVILGNAHPDFYGGLTNNFTYKNFNLSIFLFSMIGHDIFNFDLAQWKYDLSASEFNKFKEVTGRWTGEGTSNDVPRAGYKPVNISDGADGAIDVMVENASFLKLKNVTLTYNLPRTILSRIGVNNASIYLQGNNLFVITKYSGFDPEANQMGGSATLLPYNAHLYPSTRNLMVGLQFGL